MSELSPQATDVLRRYCEATEAPPGAGRNSWRPVLSRAAEQRAKRRRLVIGAGMLAAAATLIAALALRPETPDAVLGDHSGSQAPHTSPPTDAPVVRARHGEHDKVPPQRPRPNKPDSKQPTATNHPVVVPTSVAKPTHKRGKLAPADARAPVRAAPSPSADRLKLEAQLIGRARMAMTAGDDQRVLALLAKHRRDFPKGVLTHERAAWETIALCRSAATDAVATRTAFERQFPDSRWASAIERACTSPSSRDGIARPGSINK